MEQCCCSVIALTCVLSIGKQHETFVALRNKISNGRNATSATRLAALVAHEIIEQVSQHGKQLLAATNTNSIDSLLGGLITEIISNSHNWLSQVHEVTALQAILKLVAKVATNHVSLFKPRFNEIVDVLVGIYLDKTSPESFREAIATMGFYTLRTLWITNGEFTTSLLDKFMTDMNAIRNDEQEYVIFVKYVVFLFFLKTIFFFYTF